MNHLPDEILQQLADQLLEGEALTAAQAHLGECPACAALLSEYREIFADLAVMPTPLPPPRFTAAVMARVAARDAQLSMQRRLALVTLAGSASLALACFALAGNGAWARQLTVVSSSALQVTRFLHVLLDALGPVFAAWRLPLLAAMAAVCIPTLMALHRSMGPRAQVA